MLINALRTTVGEARQKEVCRMARFEIYKDTAGNYPWRLKAANGTKIASSGESFDSKSNARRAAETVKSVAGTASIEEV